MTVSHRIRLVLLGLATSAVLALATRETYRLFETRQKTLFQLNDLRLVQEQFSLLASNIPPALERMDGDCLAVVTRNDRQALVRFQDRSRELGRWIEDRRAAAPRPKIMILSPFEMTVSAGELYDKIGRIFGDYLSAANQLTNAVNPSVDFDQGLKVYEQIDEASRKLLTTVSQAGAQADAIALFFHGSQQWFPPLRKLAAAFVLLAALSGLSMLLVIEIYRQVVKPLRRQLVDQETTIEQQKKLALRGEHAAAVAHEIRNPLTAISVRLHTLQRALLEGSAEHEDALVIRNEISRLNRIVEDFLQLARPAEPDTVSLSAPAALQEVRDLLAPQYTRQAIALNLEAVADARFRADPHQLKQVLINLIKNAAESIRHNGTITLRAHKGIETIRGTAAPAVIIEVQDDGPGIPSKVQDRLFEPFFSTKEHGTGLGLPIAWQIVNKHGGMLDFKSNPGEGTTFRIVLPSLEEA